MVFALGDRFEMFAAVASGIPFNVRFAHLHGGEQTSEQLMMCLGTQYQQCRRFTLLVLNSTLTGKEILGKKENVHNAGSLSLHNINMILVHKERIL